MSDHRRKLAYMAGRRAAEAGKTLAANDRPLGTVFFDDWLDGYDDVRAEQWATVRRDVKAERWPAAPQ